MKNLMLLLKLSILNVRRYARRSVASLLVMIGAVLALNVLGGYIKGSLGVLESAFVHWGARGHLIIEHPASELGRTVEGAGQIPIDEERQAAISAILSRNEDIAKIASVLRVSGTIDTGQLSTVFAGIGWQIDAIRQIKGPAYEYDVIAGQPLWQVRREDAVVLGQGLAEIIGCSVPKVGFSPLRDGEQATVNGFECPSAPVQLNVSTLGEDRVGASRFTPVGVMDWGIKEVNDRLVVLDLPQAQALMNTRSISELRVLLKDGVDPFKARDRLVLAFADAGLPLLVSSWSDRATFYHQVKGMMTSFLMFVLIVSLIVAYMSLLNSSYLNFMQRSRELATLRSMGYSSNFILTLAALENSWLAMLAGGLGVLGATAIATAVHSAGLSYTPPGSTNPVPIVISSLPMVYLLSTIVVVALAIVSSAVPVCRILRRSIVDSLSST